MRALLEAAEKLRAENWLMHLNLTNHAFVGGGSANKFAAALKKNAGLGNGQSPFAKLRARAVEQEAERQAQARP